VETAADWIKTIASIRRVGPSGNTCWLKSWRACSTLGCTARRESKGERLHRTVTSLRISAAVQQRRLQPHGNLNDPSGVSQQNPTLRLEGPPLEDPALVARARAGDSSAFAQLVQQYQELAFRTAFLIAGDAAEAEEASQEAIVKAYYALDRFRPEAAFRPWLLEIVANTARNRRRAAGRRKQLALRASSALMTTRADSSPEAAALAQEQRRELLAHVNQLRDDDRLAIACRYFLDLSEAETAAAMGCAPGTVKSRLSRAMQRLRQQLQGSTNVEVAHG